MVEDVPARIIGIAGVLIGLGSLGLTVFLWQRSGAVIRVKAFVRPESGTVHIEVTNTGRLAATIKRLELRDQTILKVSGGSGGEAAFSRWSIGVPMNETDSSVELAPTAYVEVDYPVHAVLDKAEGVTTVTIAAWAQRGDGKWVSSPSVQLR
jgi:hypothetical protein